VVLWYFVNGAKGEKKKGRSSHKKKKQHGLPRGEKAFWKQGLADWEKERDRGEGAGIGVA